MLRTRNMTPFFFRFMLACRHKEYILVIVTIRLSLLLVYIDGSNANIREIKTKVKN